MSTTLAAARHLAAGRRLASHQIRVASAAGAAVARHENANYQNTTCGGIGGTNGTRRGLAMKRRIPIDEEFAPNETIDSIKPHSSDWLPINEEKDFLQPLREKEGISPYVRKPVTSAYMIDITANPPVVSTIDVATLTMAGGVKHGRYGELNRDVLETVPLEYLALLHPAAEATAAIRTLSKDGGGGGTVLVYGASQPSGIAAVQMATANGLATAAVVDGQHSGHDELCDTIKNMAVHPGFAVPEEYAMVKANFRDLVNKTVDGGDTYPKIDCDTDFLPEFRENLLAYIDAYPSERGAAVSPEEYKFPALGKEKDRTHFKDNINAYLDQFPPGSSPIPQEELQSKFTKELYAIWKQRFGDATSSIISGDTIDDFFPSKMVQDLMDDPQPLNDVLLQKASPHTDGSYVPYEFSVLERKFPVIPPTNMGGGPIVGAIIVATPMLRKAAMAVDKAGTGLRAKAEALQFLSASERNAYAAACSVASLAKSADGDVLVVGGSLPGLKSVEPTKDDIQEALSAMEVKDDGTSKLNFFVQVYRAGDYPVYASYAVHRATEELAGPRSIIVTK